MTVEMPRRKLLGMTASRGSVLLEKIPGRESPVPPEESSELTGK